MHAQMKFLLTDLTRFFCPDSRNEVRDIDFPTCKYKNFNTYCIPMRIRYHFSILQQEGISYCCLPYTDISSSVQCVHLITGFFLFLFINSETTKLPLVSLNTWVFLKSAQTRILFDKLRSLNLATSSSPITRPVFRPLPVSRIPSRLSLFLWSFSFVADPGDRIVLCNLPVFSFLRNPHFSILPVIISPFICTGGRFPRRDIFVCTLQILSTGSEAPSLSVYFFFSLSFGGRGGEALAYN